MFFRVCTTYIYKRRRKKDRFVSYDFIAYAFIY